MQTFNDLEHIPTSLNARMYYVRVSESQKDYKKNDLMMDGLPKRFATQFRRLTTLGKEAFDGILVSTIFPNCYLLVQISK